MNKIEKNDSRSLKREKLKTFLSERRAQKGAQATARKETARRFKSEQRARLVSERVQVRQQKEALKAAKIQSRIKINSAKADKTASLPVRANPEKRKVFAGGKTERSSGEEVNPSFPAPAVKGEKGRVILKEDVPAPRKLSRPEKRRQLLLYLTKLREAKAEGLVCKKEEKKAAVIKKQSRRAEAENREQSRLQMKPILQAQKKAGETIPAIIGQTHKRQQLLSYLKKRKAGAKTFAVQRRELKKITGAVIPEVTAAPAVPEVIPVIMPLAVPEITPPEISGVAPENIAEPDAVEPVVSETEKTATRRFKLPLAKGKKIPSEAAPDVKTAVLKKPFKIIPFLRAHSVKIIFGLLVLGWFVEIAMLNKRLENVRQQVERASSIARPRASNEVTALARTLPPNVGTTRVEGIRDPFSNELWRVQEITPAQAKAVGIRPVKVPAPSSIIKPIIPILVTKPPEFTPPQIAKAIPESAKLAQIPQITVPQVGSVSAPAAPVSSLRFRGILNVAGIDYFFIEGASGGYRVRIGDTVEGFKIYDYRNSVLYFARDGYTYQLNEERASPPLHYRGRMIMAGQEYFFLEGQRTYRAVIGEEIEGYQLVKRVGDFLYFVKDDRLYYLKQE